MKQEYSVFIHKEGNKFESIVVLSDPDLSGLKGLLQILEQSEVCTGYYVYRLGTLVTKLVK